MSETIADAEADVTDLAGATTVETDQDDEGQSGITKGFEAEQDDDGPDDLPSTAFSPINFNVTTRRISDIYSSFNDNELDTTPAFQRGYVWDKIKASKLIESVLLHVPLPLIYTAEESDGSEVVIDGQQRLMTFIGFLKGEFPKDKRPFKLLKLKILKNLNGKSFAELDQPLKIALRRYGVSIIKIANTTDENVKFEIFERLNTGAVTLSPQELRNCIYRGPLNDLIKDLSVCESFTRVLALQDRPQRMVDCEMVLRFFAFNERTHLNFTGKMKSFMNDFMKSNQYLSVEKQAEWRGKFLLACDNTFTVFGDKGFRRYRSGTAKDQRGSWEGAINKALFDCTMFWLARYEKRQIVAAKDAIREGAIHLMASSQPFIDATTLGTSDITRVKTRFEEFRQMLERAIKLPARERRLYSLAEKKELFEADPTCAFCKQRIESLDDAEVDHKKRFADGGETSSDNSRLSHRYCNRANSGGSQTAS